MPRLETTQSGFTSGEWSPLMLGNTDLPGYQQCASKLENWLVLMQRGARSRWGTRFISEIADSTKAARLMGFRYSSTQSYIIELGNLTARFYDAVSKSRIESPPGTPVQATTPWTSAQLPDLNWRQFGDTAIVTHPDVVPYRIVRISSTQWKIQAAPFVVFPSAESGTQPGADLTLGALSGATTATASVASFLAGDVGRQIIADIGEATITGFTSTTVVNVTANPAFLSLTYASGNWTITESPKTTCTLSGNNRKNGAVTATLAANGWRGADIGKYININDGMIEIIGFTSALIVTCIVREVMADSTAVPFTTPAQSGAWSLEPKTWSATRGFPRAVALAEQRSIFGGSLSEPVTIWASPTGLIYDLSRGETRQAAGFTLRLLGFDMSTIMHLVSTPTTLIALTAAAEMSAGTGQESPLSSTTIRPRTGSVNGASACRPAMVNNDLWFVQAGGLRIRALAFTTLESAFWSPDISWQSEHLFQSGIKELAFSKDPHPIAYAVMQNGTIAACTVSRQSGNSAGAASSAGSLQHDILAWAPQTTDGLFESISTARSGGEDQLWMVVNRTIGGVTKRYVELADYSLQTDCAITGTAGTPTSTWSGVGHLEGKTVQILGDAAECANQVVVSATVMTAFASGLVGAPRPVLGVEIGLPFVATLTIPDIEAAGNSFGGANVRTHRAFIDVVDTIGLELQTDPLKWIDFGATAFNSPPTPYTGKKDTSNMGWDGGPITVRRVHPYKAYIRRIIRKYTVNE